MRRLNYYWRLFATLWAFSLFGIGGLLLGITIFPVIYLLPIDKVKKKHKYRAAWYDKAFAYLYPL